MKGLHTKENGTVSFNGNVIAIDKELAKQIAHQKETEAELVKALEDIARMGGSCDCGLCLPDGGRDKIYKIAKDTLSKQRSIKT